MARRSAPEVNAGSMADIAFLLLIFFLVTTTIEVDSGIQSKLPPPLEDDATPPPVKEKNIFEVIVNQQNQLQVEGELMEIKDLTAAAVDFLDNGGGEGPAACNYCKGDRDPESSDNPDKAIISLRNDRLTTYNTYATVYNELVRAYTILRNRESQGRFNESFEDLYQRYKEWPETEKETPEYETISDQVSEIRDLFPLKLSEAEPQKN